MTRHCCASFFIMPERSVPKDKLRARVRALAKGATANFLNHSRSNNQSHPA